MILEAMAEFVVPAGAYAETTNSPVTQIGGDTAKFVAEVMAVAGRR